MSRSSHVFPVPWMSDRLGSWATVFVHECQGAIHRVALIRGKLAFFHHTVAELKAASAAHALGAEVLPCAEFFMQWRSRSDEAPPPHFSTAYTTGLALGVERQKWADRCRRDCPRTLADVKTTFMRSIWRDMTQADILTRLLIETYRMPLFVSSIGLKPEPALVRTSSRPPYLSYSLREGVFPALESEVVAGPLLWTVHIRDDWYKRVYLKGLAVLDGHVVVDAGEDAGGVRPVVAVRVESVEGKAMVGLADAVVTHGVFSWSGSHA